MKITSIVNKRSYDEHTGKIATKGNDLYTIEVNSYLNSAVKLQVPDHAEVKASECVMIYGKMPLAINDNNEKKKMSQLRMQLSPHDAMRLAADIVNVLATHNNVSLSEFLAALSDTASKNPKPASKPSSIRTNK